MKFFHHFKLLFLITIFINYNIQAQATDKGDVYLNASLVEDSSYLSQGIHWFIFKQENNKQKLTPVRQEKGGSQTLKLPSGKYTLVTIYGYANHVSEFEVFANQEQTINITLNAGLLSLTAHFANLSSKKNASEFSFKIQPLNEMLIPIQPVLVDRLPPEKTIITKQGIYEITTYYHNQIAAKNNLYIVPGRHTKAKIALNVAQITLGLVKKNSQKKHLPNVFWTIIDATSDIVYEKEGTTITPILTAGTYTVLAKYNGKTYEKTITVNTGQNKTIEILIEQNE